MAGQGGGNRKAHGPRAVAEAVSALVKPLFAKRGLADGKVASDWPHIAGEELAAHSLPEKISYSPHSATGGVLVLRIDNGGLATQLQHLEPLLIERINRHFGYAAVGRIRLVQGPLPPRPAHRLPPPPRQLEPEEEADLQTMVDGVGDSELRQALQRLGRMIKGME